MESSRQKTCHAQESLGDLADKIPAPNAAKQEGNGFLFFFSFERSLVQPWVDILPLTRSRSTCLKGDTRIQSEKYNEVFVEVIVDGLWPWVLS